LVIKVYDDEGIQAAELLGCAQVTLKDLQPGKVKDVWLNLVKDLELQRDKKYRGQVSYIIFQIQFFFRWVKFYLLSFFSSTVRFHNNVCSCNMT